MHGSTFDVDRPAQFERIHQARHELAEVETVPEIKLIRDRAEQLRASAQNRDLGLDLQNQAAELKLQAERKLGSRLADMKLRGGDRKSVVGGSIRLKDLGIDKNQSARWQQEASVPEAAFREYVLSANAEGNEISSAALLRLAKQIRRCQPRPSDASEGSHLKVTRPRSPFHQHGTAVAADVHALGVRELVHEGKNHVDTLTGLFELLCERANLEPGSGELRACRRYLSEISLHFDYVLREMRRMSDEHQFLTSAIPA